MQFKFKRTISTLVATMVVAPMWAWKSDKVVPGTHRAMFTRAFELLRLAFPEKSGEWGQVLKTEVIGGRDVAVSKVTTVADAMAEYGSTLDADANAHGNIMLPNEWAGPDDSAVDNSAKSTDFNSGPFYRFWIRAQEVHGQINTGLADKAWPEGGAGPSRIWKRFPAVRRSNEDMYRYLAYMTHLVQDQCAVAHSANIMHAVWEGMEWWHWDGGLTGGKGRSIPHEASYLRQQVAVQQNSSDPWGVDNFANYFWGDLQLGVESRKTNRGFARGGRLDQKNYPYFRVSAFLSERVIPDIQNLYMTGLSANPEFQTIFKSPQNGGWALDAQTSKAIWAAENRSHFVSAWVPSGGNEFEKTSLKVQDLSLSGLPGIERILADRRNGKGRLPMPEGGLFAGQQLCFTMPTHTSPAWQNYNSRCAFWIPNGDYQGEAFDTRWGSYGGYWGFPGRGFVGPSPGADYLGDFFTSMQGRIQPGDLYLTHSDPKEGTYDPERQQPVALANPVDPAVPLGYLDERSWLKLRSNGFDTLGELALDKAAVWSAICMENLSRAIPPRIKGLVVEPRANPQWGPERQRQEISEAVPWMGSEQGAWLSLSLWLNRLDDYFVEFYAIPRSEFHSDPGGNAWRRTLTLGQDGKVLFDSDISVNDGGGANAYDGKPVDNPALAPLSRKYDYVYGGIKGYRLKVHPGKRPFLEGRSSESGVTLLELNQKQADLDLEATWMGEVEKVASLFENVDPAPLKADDSTSRYSVVTRSRYPVVTRNGKNFLPDGDYLILTMAYRKNWRNAFARNQYKSQTWSRRALEAQGEWGDRPWTDVFVDEGAVKATDNAPVSTMIPDELAPIRWDLNRPSIR
ncbi:MAG: hypothetical protein Q8O00_09415 [Holophaga sp.]|nr:hypothetical protein [Holophaga sp.]